MLSYEPRRKTADGRENNVNEKYPCHSQLTIYMGCIFWGMWRISQSVQLLSRVRLFATPGTTACQASLSITNSLSSLKLMCIESVMPSNHLILCHFHSFPASGSLQMSQLFTSGGQSIGDSASASVLPMNSQDWFPLGWTGWIPLKSTGFSSVFSNTTVQKYQFKKKKKEKYQFFNAQLSLQSNSHIHTWLLEKP